MKIHEYQAKSLLKKFAIPVSPGELVEKLEDALPAYERLGGGLVAVKAQIHAGGRGKGGGIKLVKNADELKEAAKKILGMQLVTPQTGPQGKKVNRIYLEKAANIQKEMYLAILLDRDSSQLMFVGAAEGGMDIEELAKDHPEKIIQQKVDPMIGFRSFQGRELAAGLGLPIDMAPQLTALCQAMVMGYFAFDASLIEINPLVLTKENKLLALDAKFTIDDNAIYRQPEIAAMRDLSEEDPLEIEASKFGLNYIALDGEIGCMVNGAGLAMATMDVIKLAGAEPANFLDVGGGATQEAVTQAFQIILKDKKVKAILVNIFGGIMKCDIIARGIVEAAKITGLKLPLVVRLQGTHAPEGRKILNESGLPIITAETIDEAARKVVEAAKKMKAA